MPQINIFVRLQSCSLCVSFWEENQHNFSSFKMERFEKSTYEFLKDLSRSWNFKLN